MIPLPQQCVLDASVIMEYLVPQSETQGLLPLFHNLLVDEKAILYAPDLIYVECANVLWKKTRRGELNQTTAEDTLADLYALEMSTILISDAAPRALQLAGQYTVSAYDACYLAVSERFGVPFITADSRLVNCLQGTPYQVLALKMYL